jgi:hypothetical protein
MSMCRHQNAGENYRTEIAYNCFGDGIIFGGHGNNGQLSEYRQNTMARQMPPTDSPKHRAVWGCNGVCRTSCWRSLPLSPHTDTHVLLVHVAITEPHALEYYCVLPQKHLEGTTGVNFPALFGREMVGLLHLNSVRKEFHIFSNYIVCWWCSQGEL